MRMRAQEVVELITKKAGKDELKQIEPAAAVKDRLTDVNANKDLPVGLAIVESVKLVQGDQEQVQGQVPQRYPQPLPWKACIRLSAQQMRSVPMSLACSARRVAS